MWISYVIIFACNLMLIFHSPTAHSWIHVKWQVRPVDLHHAGFSMIRQRQCSLISTTRHSSRLQLISELFLCRPLNRSIMRLLHILGFTLLLCSLCVRAEEKTAEEKVEDSSEEDTEPEKPEKTDEITEEKDVLVLHSVNFDRALSENKYLLVEFCKYSMTLL